MADFADTARNYGRSGWIKRFGIRFVPAERRDAVRAGTLPLAQARIPYVQAILMRHAGGIDLRRLARETGLCLASTAAVLTEMKNRGMVVRAGRRPARWRLTSACRKVLED